MMFGESNTFHRKSGVWGTPGCFTNHSSRLIVLAPS
jgi:hypothetical protein